MISEYSIPSIHPEELVIKKLILLIDEQLNQGDFEEMQRTILRIIELFDSVPRKYGVPDLTLEIKDALEKVKKVIALKKRIVDALEMTKLNFNLRDNSKAI